MTATYFVMGAILPFRKETKILNFSVGEAEQSVSS